MAFAAMSAARAEAATFEDSASASRKISICRRPGRVLPEPSATLPVRPIARLPEKASGRNSLPKTEGRRPDSQFFMMRYLWRLCSLQTRRSAERVTDGRNQPRNERSSDKGDRKPIFDRHTAISTVWFVVHPVGVTVRDFEIGRAHV